MGDVISMPPRSLAERRARATQLLGLYHQQEVISRELVRLLGRERAGAYLRDEAAIALKGFRDPGASA